MSSHEDLHRQLETIYVLLQDGTRRALAPVGLTPTQYSLLALVADAPREGLSITTLASRLLCTRGNASRLVGRLMTAGLVSTGSVSTDERLVLVRLTRTGRERLDVAREAIRLADEARFAAVADDHLDCLRTDLASLEDGLRSWLATP